MEENYQQLIEAAVAGDREALVQLLEKHADALQSRLKGRVSTRWQALLGEDDILQQTFADAFMGIKRFQYAGENSFINWLTRIALNNIKDAVKHLEAVKSGGERQQVVAGSDESYHRLMNGVADSMSTPSRQAMRGELCNALKAALDRLPTGYRDVVMGYDIEGCSPAELAQRLGCSQGALFMRRSRALKLLAGWLENDQPG